MGGFKDKAIDGDQTKTLVDHCDECGSEIYAGAQAWKVGSNLLCTRSCMLEYVGATRVTVKEE